MILKKLFILTTFIICFACSKERKLLKIETVENLTTLARSANNNLIEKKGKSLLTFHEIVNKTHTYKKIQTVYENEKIKALLILSESIENKGVHILLRTFNQKDNKIIDTFLLSSYNKETKEFCSGSITENLKLERFCESVNFSLKKQIDAFGKIITIPN